MNEYSSQSLAQQSKSAMSSRIRQAGLAAIVGAIVLFGSFVWLSVIDLQGQIARVNDPAYPVYYLSNGGFLVGWGLLLVGLLGLRAQYGTLRSRLWRAGVVVSSIGLGLATAGFTAIVAAPLLEAPGIFAPGDTAIGIGFLLFVPVGAILLGLALRRAETVTRLAAISLIVAGPANVLGIILSQQTMFVSTLLLVPFSLAWVLIGYDLWTTAGSSRSTEERDRVEPTSPELR